MSRFIIPAFLLLVLVFAPQTVAVAQPAWQQHVVAMYNDYVLPTDLALADMNDDGHTNLLTISELQVSVDYWSWNGVEWVRNVIGGPLYNLHCAAATDIDNDGDTDALVGALGTNMVYLVENAEEHWLQQEMAEAAGPRDLEPADINQDGLLDLVVSTGGGEIFWYKQQPVGEWITTLIAPTYGDCHDLGVTDFDDDGDLDIAACRWDQDDIRWYENDGTGEFTDLPLDPNLQNPYCLTVADLNGDGLDDIVVGTLTGEIVWYERVGDEWIRHDVYQGNAIRSVATGDIDNDGDIDLAVARNGSEIVWMEQTDDFWLTHLVREDMDTPRVVKLGYINQDDRLDIAAIAHGDYAGISEIAFWIQTEPPLVNLTLIPVETNIPESGGTVVYNAHLESSLATAIPGVTYWTSLVLPNGQEFSPMVSFSFVLTPFMDVSVTGLTQSIPALAPPGTYYYRGHVGLFPTPEDDDSFSFFKEGDVAATMPSPAIPYSPEQWQGTVPERGHVHQAPPATLRNENR